MDFTQAMARFEALQRRENPGLAGRRADRPDWVALHRQALELAARIRRAQALPDPAEKNHRVAAAYKTTAENYLRNQVRARVRHTELLRPLYFIFSLLDACNQDCVYCDDHAGMAHPDVTSRDAGRLDLDGVTRVLQVMRSGVSSVFFTGGEPTLRPDLPQVISAAARLGYYPITLNSNASLLASRLLKPGWSRLLAQTDVLSISLDSLSPSTMQSMYAGAGDKLSILRNLLALRELAEALDLKLGINVVLQPGGVGHARDVMDFANALGISFAGVPQNRGGAAVAGLAEDPAYPLFARVLLDRIREGYRFMGPYRFNQALFQDRPLLLRGAPVACHALLKPYVGPDGVCELPCNTATESPKVRLSVLDCEDLDAIWARAARSLALEDYAERCGGDCRWAQHLGAEYYYWGLFHPLDALREVYRYSH